MSVSSVTGVLAASEPAQGALTLQYNTTTNALTLAGLTGGVQVYSVQIDATFTGAPVFSYTAPSGTGLMSQLNQTAVGTKTEATLLLDSPAAPLNSGSSLALGKLTFGGTDLQAITESITMKLLSEDVSIISHTGVTVTNVTTSGGSSSGSSSSSSASTTSRPIQVTSPKNGSVLLSGSKSTVNKLVTITVKPEDGYALDVLQVLDESNNAITLTHIGDGVYTFIMPASEVRVAATFALAEQTETPWTNPFADVKESAWYYEAVKYANENGLFSGVSENNFAPTNTMTRAMLWSSLARMAGEDTSGGATWYAKAQDWAKANGISDGSNPSNNITREQLVTILYRYAQQQGLAVSHAGAMGMAGYVDVDEISSYATEAMHWGVLTGLIKGSGDSLNPKGNATRAEVASILMRYIETVK